MENIDELKSFIKSINNKNPYEMFSIDEAAIAFNLSKQRITAALNDKELNEYKIDNKQRMIKRQDMEKWIDSKAVIKKEPLRYKMLNEIVEDGGIQHRRTVSRRRVRLQNSEKR